MFSTNHPTFYPLEDDASKTGTVSSGDPTRQLQTRRPGGEVIAFVSRGLLPHTLTIMSRVSPPLPHPRFSNPAPNATQRRTDVATCEGWGDTSKGWDDNVRDRDEPWTAVGTVKPTRTPFHPQSCEEILELVWQADMAKSARRAVTGDGVCIGRTYKTEAFVHP